MFGEDPPKVISPLSDTPIAAEELPPISTFYSLPRRVLSVLSVSVLYICTLHCALCTRLCRLGHLTATSESSPPITTSTSHPRLGCSTSPTGAHPSLPFTGCPWVLLAFQNPPLPGPWPRKRTCCPRAGRIPIGMLIFLFRCTSLIPVTAHRRHRHLPISYPHLIGAGFWALGAVEPQRSP